MQQYRSLYFQRNGTRHEKTIEKIFWAKDNDNALLKTAKFLGAKARRNPQAKITVVQISVLDRNHWRPVAPEALLALNWYQGSFEQLQRRLAKKHELLA